MRKDTHSRYGNHSHTKIAPLVTKITYIKMDPLRCIRNGFANGSPTHSHFYAACTSRHEPSMIPKALKFATLQKKNARIPPQTYQVSILLSAVTQNKCHVALFRRLRRGGGARAHISRPPPHLTPGALCGLVSSSLLRSMAGSS